MVSVCVSHSCSEKSSGAVGGAVCGAVGAGGGAVGAGGGAVGAVCWCSL